MIVNLDGVDHRIRFEYLYVTDLLSDTKEPYATICTIEKGNGYTIQNSETKREWNKVVEGMTVCSEEDQFDRVVGRKVALTRALKGLPKEHRKIIWDAYLSSGCTYTRKYKHGVKTQSTVNL